jgi:hypothetical protein
MTSVAGPAGGEPGAGGAPVWADQAQVGFHGRATFQLSSDGVTPVDGTRVDDGNLTPKVFLGGELLVVGYLDDVPRSTTSEHDPRTITGIAAEPGGPAFAGMAEEGDLRFAFPGQHIETRAHLLASRFEVYQLVAVDSRTQVTPDNIDVLLEDAVLLGTVEGETMLQWFF